jgi:hypothetical protein
MTRYLVAATLLCAAAIGADQTGLSKGPENPADIGNRCAVLAGRGDRAYLDCAEQGRTARNVNEATGVERRRTDDWTSGHESRPARRYPLRSR